MANRVLQHPVEDRIPSVAQKDSMDNAVNPNHLNPLMTESEVNSLVLTVVGGRVHPAVADIAALKAIPAINREDKLLCYVEDDIAGNNGLFRFDAEAAQAENLPFIVAPTAGSGRWIQMTRGVSKHNGLGEIQGGTTDEYYHLTADQNAACAGTAGAPALGNEYVT